MSVRRRGRGFTLIEVLVALVVLAFALGGGLTIAGLGARNAARLENTVLAHWVAMNAYNQLGMTGIAPQPPVSSRTDVIMGRRYLVRTRLGATAGDGRASVLIEVASAEDPTSVIESIAGAIGSGQ